MFVTTSGTARTKCVDVRIEKLSAKLNLRNLKQVNCVEYVKRLKAAEMRLVRIFVYSFI